MTVVPARSFEALPDGLWVPEGTVTHVRLGSRSGLGRERGEDLAGFIQLPATLQELLGFQSPSLEQILELIAELPFEASMDYLSVLSVGLYHARRETRLHMQLAQEVFGAGLMLDAVREFIARGPDRLVFDERYVTLLQRLLVEHASNDPAKHLTQWQHATLLTCLFALGDALVEWEPPEPDQGDDYDVSLWTIYAIQRGAYYNSPDMLEGIVRASTMLIEIAAEQDLREHPDYCPLETWSSEDANGAGLADQLACGLAFIGGMKILDPTLRLAERPVYLEPGYMAAGAFADREAQIFSAVSASREEFRTAYANAGRTPEHIAWDHAPFEQRPLLRRADGSYILISASAIESWMGRGLYFRMLDAAKSRKASEDSPTRLGHRFTAFTGVLAERYVLRMVSRSHEAAPTERPVEVSGDRIYFIGKRELRTPDVAVAQPPDLVLMEVYSGGIPREARVGATVASMEGALDKMILSKLSELQDRIADLLAGHVTLPGLGHLDAHRIWPMLVLTGDQVFQLPMLWRWVQGRLPEGAFGDTRVQPPTICNLDDLEPLLVLVERGESLPELLAEFHGSLYAQFPPRNWIAANRSLTLSERPTYVQERCQAIINDMHRRLFP